MARQTETKTYVFRPHGEDEGWVAVLTEKQAERIQKRVDKMENERGEPPFYLYPMDVATAQEINAILTETKELGL
jgi:hypothetical protein